MIYAISDINGYYEQFLNLLKKIEFSDLDTLYVLGNVMDLGPEPINLLMDLSYRYNIIPILGERDYLALRIFKKLLEEEKTKKNVSMSKELTKEYMNWLERGGKITVEQFRELTLDDKESLVEYLEEFQLYEEVKVKDTDYLLISSGIKNFEVNKNLEEYELEDFIKASHDYEKEYIPHKKIITGFKQTRHIDKALDDEIFENEYNIAVNCGIGYGGKLGIYCLNNGEKEYIS